MLDEVDPEGWTARMCTEGKPSYRELVLNYGLSQLCMTKVKGLNLGEADPTLLPLSEITAARQAAEEKE